jgi:predicted MFS family arabinose efflux permease
MGGADCRLRRGRDLLYPGRRPPQRHSGARAATPGAAPSPRGYQGRRRLRPGSPDAAPRVRNAVCFNTAFFMLLATFVPHAVGNLGLSATGTGLTLAMFGVGMVVGALYAPRLLRQLAYWARC